MRRASLATIFRPGDFDGLAWGGFSDDRVASWGLGPGMFGYRLTRVDWVLLPILAGALGAVAYLAFRWLGFFGIGLLGLVTGLVAVNVDLQRGWPAGSWATIGATSAARDAMSRAERAAWRADLARDRVPIFVAKVAAAGMVILGFGLFALVQLPG